MKAAGEERVQPVGWSSRLLCILEDGPLGLSHSSIG